jgi:hypothetical protein
MRARQTLKSPSKTTGVFAALRALAHVLRFKGSGAPFSGRSMMKNLTYAWHLTSHGEEVVSLSSHRGVHVPSVSLEETVL